MPIYDKNYLDDAVLPSTASGTASPFSNNKVYMNVQAVLMTTLYGVASRTLLYASQVVCSAHALTTPATVAESHQPRTQTENSSGTGADN